MINVGKKCRLIYILLSTTTSKVLSNRKRVNEKIFENTCEKLDVKMNGRVPSSNSHLNLEELVEYYHQINIK